MKWALSTHTALRTPFSLQSSARSWYFRPFLSWASSQPFPQGTVNSTRMAFFTCSDQMMMSGLSGVGTIGGKLSFLPRSTLISHPCAFWRMVALVLLVAVHCSPARMSCNCGACGLFLACSTMSVITVSTCTFPGWVLCDTQPGCGWMCLSSRKVCTVGLLPGPAWPGLQVMRVCHTQISKRSLCGMVPTSRVRSIWLSLLEGPIWSSIPGWLVQQDSLSIIETMDFATLNSSSTDVSWRWSWSWHDLILSPTAGKLEGMPSQCLRCLLSTRAGRSRT